MSVKLRWLIGGIQVSVLKDILSTCSISYWRVILIFSTVVTLLIFLAILSDFASCQSSVISCINV